MGGGKVGVFTALYNHGKRVGQASVSISSQKRMPSEVIVLMTELQMISVGRRRL
jgi:hypothetical protein